MTETTVNKNLERKLRRALHKHGYSLCKSRVKKPHYFNQGGYRIVLDWCNGCVAGPNYDYSLDDVVKWAKDIFE